GYPPTKTIGYGVVQSFNAAIHTFQCIAQLRHSSLINAVDHIRADAKTRNPRIVTIQKDVLLGLRPEAGVTIATDISGSIQKNSILQQLGLGQCGKVMISKVSTVL